MQIDRATLEKMIADPASNPEEIETAERLLSAQGPTDDLPADSLYQQFLSPAEIRVIAERARPETEDLDELLAIPSSGLEGCLRVGVANLHNGKWNPADLNLPQGILLRVAEHWEEITR